MSVVSAFDTVTLDAGDEGLVFIDGVGFRPAEGADLFHGQIVENVCVIKCHVGYDDLPEEITNYVPMCGGEDGPGKWVGKWQAPTDPLAPPVWYTAAPVAPLVPTPVYTTPGTPIWTTPTPWDTPWTYCCSTTTTTPDPPMSNVDLPETFALMASVLLILVIVARFGQTMRLLAEIKRTN